MLDLAQESMYAICKVYFTEKWSLSNEKSFRRDSKT